MSMQAAAGSYAPRVHPHGPNLTGLSLGRLRGREKRCLQRQGCRGCPEQEGRGRRKVQGPSYGGPGNVNLIKYN
jgi:hypothetical protein